MKQYKTRIVDRILREKLESKGAVLIEGAKWCGKTTTASQLAKSILYMQDPEKVRQNIELSELKVAGRNPPLCPRKILRIASDEEK